MKKITYYFRGPVEVACFDAQGSPWYEWRNGYSEDNEEGFTVYPWMTRRECQLDAKRRGAVAVFAYMPAKQVRGKEHAT